MVLHLINIANTHVATFRMFPIHPKSGKPGDVKQTSPDYPRWRAFSQTRAGGGTTGAVANFYWSEFFNRHPFDMVRDIE